MTDQLLRFFLSIEGLAVALGWIVVITRFGIIVRHELEGNGSTNRLAWLMWALFFMIVMAGTTHHPMVIHFIGNQTAEWFAQLPRVLFAVIAYIVTVYICYEFAPSLKPKCWNWPLISGVVLLVAYSLILRITSLGGGAFPRSPAYYSELVADPLFHFYLLLIASRVVLPALTRARRVEEQEPMRLRFQLMSVTHVAVVVWMLNETIGGLGQVLPFQYSKNLIYKIALMSFLISFLFSYFMPAKYFVLLVRAGQYFGNLTTLGLIRSLQVRTARLAGGESSPKSLTHFLRSPALMIYLSVIDILDHRKKLKSHPDRRAHALSAQLDRAANEEYSYQEVVRVLRRVSWEEWMSDVRVKAFLKESIIGHV